MPMRSSFLICSLIVITAAHPRVASAQTTAQPPKPTAAPPSPQSTHYPILLLGHGSNPPWSVLIGQKGPERLDRANYPPITLEPGPVEREGTAEAWSYRAKDSASGGQVTVHLARENCLDTTGNVLPEISEQSQTAGKTKAPSANSVSPAKYTFRVSLEHSQIGTLNGCARIAAELFPKITNQSEDDDPDKKKPPTSAITSFKAPTATAFVNPAGKIVISRGAVKKIAGPSGVELALSHDGKKLLYTRNDSKMGSDRTIVLYDFDSGRSKDLVHGPVRQAFWSLDDARVAYLQSQDQKWQVWSFAANTPESAAILFSGNVDALHGWVDSHTLLASDAQNMYWIGDDRPQQTLPLKDVYGDAFRISATDTIRINPANPDLLLVSAKYAAPPANAPADASGISIYEIRAKRRVSLAAPEIWASHAEWSRDGIQIFYTRRVSATSSVTFRSFWDGSAARRYQDGTDLVVGQ